MKHLAALVAWVFLTASAAWATTTPPTSTPQGEGVPAGTGGDGFGDNWWIVAVVIVVVVAAAWYAMRRNKTSS